MELFFHSVSLGDERSHIEEELSRKIVRHCNGFPLAITVVGRSLCKQPIEIWRKKVIEWSKGSSILDSETKLLLCLQSSLDALDKEMATIKECFLDLGSFPEDYRIPVSFLIDIWAELYDLDEDALCFANVCELINRNLANLIDKRTIKLDGEEYYNEHYVRQHDMLRELAIYHSRLDQIEHRKRVIIEICGNNIPKWWREQKYQPIKARLLSISTDKQFSMKWPNMQLPEAEVLILHFRTKYYGFPEFVEKMDKLKVVVVCCIMEEAELSNFEVVGLLPNLQRIALQRILLRSITKKPIKVQSLKKIFLTSCDLSQAFSEGSVKMSDAFPNLEELSIENCSRVGKLPAGLCDLIHLKKLNITYIDQLYALPEDIGDLINLEVLRIRSCPCLRKLPCSIWKLKKLIFLDIFNLFIERLPDYIDGISSLRKLDMRLCNKLKELPLTILNFEQLEEVICDNETKDLWKPFLPVLINTRIVVTPCTE